MNNKPICIGSGLIALDILIKSNDYRNLSYYVGGSCGNVLTILAYFGWDSYPVARFSSNNKYTTRLLSNLSDNSVHLDYISELEDGSTPVIIQRNIIDKNGNPHHKFELKNPETGEFLPRFKSITKSMADSIISNTHVPNVFYFDRITPGILDLAKKYKEKKALIVCEPSSIGDEKKFAEVISIVDILKFSNQRISNYDLLARHSQVPLEIETLGEKGLRYRCNFLDKKWHELEAPKIENIVDSSGAGDWTTSGIIYYLQKEYKNKLLSLSQQEVEMILNFAQKLGALNCTFEGARGLMQITKEEIFKGITRIL